MKCLTVFVHGAVRDALLECLRASPVVTGFTLTDCQGHSVSTASDSVAADIDRVVGYVPRVRVDVILESRDVDRLLAQLGSLGGAGLGAWMVTDVERFGRL